MIIHVVVAGETLHSISDFYKVSIECLIEQNGITNPNDLVIGQTIVIYNTNKVYIVKEGDTLFGIAKMFDTSTNEILRNNPFITTVGLIPGETIIISMNEKKTRSIIVSGYAYPYLGEDTLKMTLPYLTYLTIFNYRVNKEGELNELDDERIIRIAKSYGVAPMMLISSLSESGVGDPDVAFNILNNEAIQNKLIGNVLKKLKEKGYYGLNIYIQYLRPENRELVEAYIKKVYETLHKEGYRLVVTTTPRTNIERTELQYEKIDLSTIAQYVDALLIASYEWGYSYGPPASVTPVNIVKTILNDITQKVPSNKLVIGLPIVGYDWALPYVPGISKASAITTTAAIELAFAQNVEIEYSEESQAPFFFYGLNSKNRHIVWFKDARSIDAISDLVPEYELQGLSIWNIMFFFTQMWLMINYEYDIDKVIKPQ